MSDAEDTARRERAWANSDERPWSFQESDIRWAMSLSTCSVETTAMLNYLAGSRDEAAIKDAEIATLETTANGLKQCCEEYRQEIAALREAVRHLHWVADKPTVYPMRFCDAVRRALEEKP